jgi:hypothetical protein
VPSPPAAPAGLPGEVSYARDVRPILAEFCWRCHGPVEGDRQAGLRLDDRTAATASLPSGQIAIVPHRPETSELLRRVITTDADLRMPPPQSGKAPTARQVAILEQWIAAGAPFESHWAYRPVRRPALPEVRDPNAVSNPVDRFIFSRLEQAGLPIPDAAPQSTQLRRLSFALRGLPPTLAELQEHEGRSDPPARNAAWNEAIDHMLSTTAYGEHWARHWMDVVRYADSAGYELDYLLDHSHRYRDWLIRSLRDNMPMDRFLQAQLAGDQLWPDSADATDAVLFLAIGPRRFEGGIQRTREREYEWLTDVADTVGSAFVGLTVGCARCHDHKYESLSQREYFGLHAVFSDCELDERRIGDSGGDARPAVLQVVPRTAAGTVHVLRRGEIDAPEQEAAPRVPTMLCANDTAGPPFGGPHRRAEFARWLTAPDHPLTARVLVNRVWQWHFGAGLVRTPNDFGVQGEFPTHPELLDWLASELIGSGWDLRHLHRLILTSRTFRATSDSSPLARDRDPENRLLSYFPRRRLQGEEIRDALLAVSGQLNDRAFGSAVVPHVEPWVLAPLRHQNWHVTPDEDEWRRRSLYLVVRRSMKLPFLDAFNAPDPSSSCGGRESSVVASQALMMLNDETSLDAARGLAARLWNATGGDLSLMVEQGWRLAFGRAPQPEEAARAIRFLGERERAWASRTPPDALTPGKTEAPPPAPPLGAALVEWSLLLLNANEFCHVE